MIPGSANPLLLKSAAAASYQIERSLRFSSNDSGYLSRTPAVAGNRKTWTWAGWVKRAVVGQQALFHAGSSNQTVLWFDGNVLEWTYYTTGYNARLTTTAVYRDFSAWMHVVFVLDTTQATANNRMRLYVNGEEVTTFTNRTNPALNDEYNVNNTVAHQIGYNGVANGYYFNGYLADIHFIDGQALTPSSFTEVSATTGQLIPKAYAGTYTGNSFWLKFNDNSAATATTLGKDSFLLGNNWTPNNLSVTAGAGNDSLVDTPTSYGTDTGVGGEVRGNYATLNPLSGSSTHPLANGNLEKVSTSGSGNRFGTFGITSGKFYWENAFTTFSGLGSCGISSNGRDANNISELKVYETSGTKYNGSSSSSYGASWGVNDVIGIAFDAGNGTLAFYKNGVSQGTAFTGLTGLTWFPVFRDDGGCTGFINFGQRAFAYTAPSGFKALCDTNLGAPLVALPNTLMDVKLWTGNATARSITGFNFSPDFVWIKNRADSVAGDHRLFDTVRGATKELYSNLTGAEATETGGLTAFNSDGFSLGTINAVNGNADGIVGWCWDAGSSTVSNTQGSITSQVRANVSAGFSVVTYSTGASSGNQTIGHGLNVTPSLIIHKVYSATSNWWVYHASTTNTVSKYIQLNSTNATADNGLSMWGAALPTSTVFGANVGQLLQTNQSAVAYVFSPVVGYSSFGSYTGNGSTDGPFVYTGFRPRWVMIKATGGSTGDENWMIKDALRPAYNPTDGNLYANQSFAEDSVSTVITDLVSNGFKIRGTYAGVNTSAVTYIYCAFAESSLQYARAR